MDTGKTVRIETITPARGVPIKKPAADPGIHIPNWPKPKPAQVPVQPERREPVRRSN